jgi:hypothetical protein
MAICKNLQPISNFLHQIIVEELKQVTECGLKRLLYEESKECFRKYVV